MVPFSGRNIKKGEVMKRIFIGLILSSVVLAGAYTRFNEIVTDSSTSKMWQDDTTPAVMEWSAAINYCEGLTLGGYTDWRLPNMNELLSLIDDTTYNPIVDSAFVNTATDKHYWSSTGTSSLNKLGVHFIAGDIAGLQTTSGFTFYVRCVRQ